MGINVSDLTLEMTEDAVSNLLKLSGDFFWEVDEQFFLVFEANSDKFFGGSTLGKPLQDIVCARTESMVDWEKFQSALASTSALANIRLNLQTSHGKIPVEGSFEPVKRANGTTGLRGVFKDIREQIRLESQRNLAEDRFNALFDASPGLISIADISARRYVDVNSTFCEFHNKGKSQFIGRPSFALSDEFETSVFRDIAEKLLMGEEIEEQFISLENHEGQLRSLRSIPIILSYEDGPKLLIISTDITAEKEFEKNNRILSIALETMQHGISLFNEDLELVLCNDRYLDLLEFPKEFGKQGTPFETVMRFNAERGEYGPGDVEELIRERIKLAEKFDPHKFERTRSNGTTIEVEGRHVPGVGFITTYSDITDRVRAEKEIRESEQLLREVVHALPFAFSLWDNSGTRVLGNYVWQEWYPEYSSIMPGNGGTFHGLVNDFIDKNLIDIGNLNREEYVEGRFRNLMNTEKTTSEVSKIGDKWLHMINKKVGTKYVASVRFDMTEQHQQQEQLRQAQKMEAVGQLTGGIAHDFNNILSVILGNAELLNELLADGPNSSLERLQAISRAASRGAELTQQLLSFSRKLELRPIETCLNDTIEQMNILLKSTIGESVKLEITKQEDLWNCHIDQGQFENSLLNMCINARDAIQGSGRVCLKTENTTLTNRLFSYENQVVSGDFIKLSVMDTGSGIRAEDIEQVFEPFFTTKEVGKGSGLGLSMVFGFVRQSGGHISVRSKVGYGTRFHIYLPRV